MSEFKKYGLGGKPLSVENQIKIVTKAITILEYCEDQELPRTISSVFFYLLSSWGIERVSDIIGYIPNFCLNFAFKFDKEVEKYGKSSLPYLIDIFVQSDGYWWGCFQLSKEDTPKRIRLLRYMLSELEKGHDRWDNKDYYPNFEIKEGSNEY